MDMSDAATGQDARGPLKRTRQACNPCRRKKSKCTGDRPVCSTCDRLRARCSYDDSYGPGTVDDPDETPSRDRHAFPSQSEVPESTQSQWQDRVQVLESTLAEVLSELRRRRSPDNTPPTIGLGPRRPGRNPARSRSPEARRATPVASMNASGTAPARKPSELDDIVSLPPQWLAGMARTYLRYCDGQPLPLLCRDDFVETFPGRDPSVVYGVLAVTSRFAAVTSGAANLSTHDPKRYADIARRLAMAEVVSERVELSTLQTLCLLALNSMHNGEMNRIRVYSTLASSLARCAGLHHNAGRQANTRRAEERRRCYWSITLMQRLIGEGPAVYRIANASVASPEVPTSPEKPLMVGQAHTSEPPGQPYGILHITIQLSEIWLLAQLYIQNRGRPEHSVPPWSSQSACSRAIESLMHLDAQFSSSAHTYSSVKMSSIGPRELEHARDYWGPWLLTRLLYHTSVCIFYHPVLLMLQLRGRNDPPELFLQQTIFQRDHHASWLLHFMDFSESRQLYISDPLFAYCIAVLATIELHQSFGDDGRALEEEQRSRQRQRHRNYEKCLGFIKKLSSTWPTLDLTVQRLELLRKDLAASYESRQANVDGNIYFDISSFFAILDINETYAASQPPGSEGSMFGHSLFAPASLELQGSVGLQRLPRICRIDKAAESPSLAQGDVVVVPGSLPGEDLLQDPLLDEGMLFSADQMFGSFFSPRMGSWDTFVNR